MVLCVLSYVLISMPSCVFSVSPLCSSLFSPSSLLLVCLPLSVTPFACCSTSPIPRLVVSVCV